MRGESHIDCGSLSDPVLTREDGDTETRLTVLLDSADTARLEKRGAVRVLPA